MSTPTPDYFSSLFGSGFMTPRPTPPAKPKPERGVPWEAKTINGEYYVPLRQVADLLDSNGVLPAVCRGIKFRVETKKTK
jgi:hypothetical protein